MNNFFDSELCKSDDEQVCRKCRRARDYRRGIIAAFDEPTDVDFECPRGKTAEDYPQKIEPNIFQMGVNFAKAMTEEAKTRMRNARQKRKANNPGPPENHVSQEEQQKRLEACQDCEFFVDGKRCAKCGCFMGFKIRLQSGHCPLKKW